MIAPVIWNNLNSCNSLERIFFPAWIRSELPEIQWLEHLGVFGEICVPAPILNLVPVQLATVKSFSLFFWVHRERIYFFRGKHFIELHVSLLEVGLSLLFFYRRNFRNLSLCKLFSQSLIFYSVPWNPVSSIHVNMCRRATSFRSKNSVIKACVGGSGSFSLIFLSLFILFSPFLLL